MTESAWERAPHQELPRQRIEDIARLALPKEVLQHADLITSGHANTNYRLSFESGLSTLLRLHVRDSAGLAREAAIARLVASTVPVPALITANEAEGWSVWEWIEGTLLEQAPALFPNTAENLGAVLAAIGAYRFKEAGLFGPNLEIDFKFGEACQGYIERMLFCLREPLCQERLGNLAPRTEQFIHDKRGLLDPYRNASQLVHADYKAANLLIQNGKVVGVLDWEFAHSGSPLLDVAILFRHRATLPPETLDHFQRGFTEAGGFLDPDWRQATRYLDLVSLLDFLSRENLGPIATKDILGLVAATVG